MPVKCKCKKKEVVNMRKKLISLVSVVVLALSMATAAFAAPANAQYKTGASTYGAACGGLGYDLMRDANGNFLSQEDFEANLDKAIADGDIASADRGYYVEMFNYCVANGGSFGGKSLGGRGCGR
jgi:hypothetical protein